MLLLKESRRCKQKVEALWVRCCACLCLKADVAEDEMKKIHGMIRDGFKTVGTAIFSSDVDERTPAQQLAYMGKAYLECSAYIFAGIIHDKVPATFHHVQAGGLLFEHALELIFKAAIVAAGKKPKDTHDLNALYRCFTELYPNAPHLFKSNIDSFTDKDPRRPFGQFSKYPIDKAGKPWSVNSHVILETATEQIALLQKDFEWLIPMIDEMNSSQAV